MQFPDIVHSPPRRDLSDLCSEARLQSSLCGLHISPLRDSNVHNNNSVHPDWSSAEKVEDRSTRRC